MTNFYDSISKVIKDKKDAEAGIGKSWGYEFIGDYAGCTEEIDDEKNIENFINELVEKLEMTKMSDLWIKQFPEKGFPNPAVSAFQGITTSSIVYHGDNDYKSFFLNVFSCKTFKKELIPPIVDKHFHPSYRSERFLIRNVGDIENA